MVSRVALGLAICFGCFTFTSSFATDRSMLPEESVAACSNLCEQWMSMGRVKSLVARPDAQEAIIRQLPSATSGIQKASSHSETTKPNLRATAFARSDLATGVQTRKKTLAADHVPLPPRRDLITQIGNHITLDTVVRTQKLVKPFSPMVLPINPTAPRLQSHPPYVSPLLIANDAKAVAAPVTFSFSSIATTAPSPALDRTAPPPSILEETPPVALDASLRDAIVRRSMATFRVSGKLITTDRHYPSQPAFSAQVETPILVRLMFYVALACIVGFLMRRPIGLPNDLRSKCSTGEI
jgi:hypothetical protein